MQIVKNEKKIVIEKKIKTKGNFLKSLKKNKSLLFMCTPAIIFFFVFSYATIPGLYVAFVNYNYGKGIFGSKFVGFDNFRFLIVSGQLWNLTRNTVLYNLAFIIFSNVLQIFVAFLLNEIVHKWYKKITQTLMFLPYFISAVLVGLVGYNILNFDYGFLNTALKSIGLSPVGTYSNPAIWPFILVFTYLWQTTGYGSIVYFAALMGIDTEIVEAASIDGANAFQRIRYILLPHLKPTFIILLLLALGQILKGNFGLFYNMVGSNNGVLFPTTDIIETFTFRALMNNSSFPMASAVGLYQSVFGFAVIMVCNTIVKKIDPDYSLF